MCNYSIQISHDSSSFRNIKASLDKTSVRVTVNGTTESRKATTYRLSDVSHYHITVQGSARKLGSRVRYR
jgi:hypothetical protein